MSSVLPLNQIKFICLFLHIFCFTCVNQPTNMTLLYLKNRSNKALGQAKIKPNSHYSNYFTSGLDVSIYIEMIMIYNHNASQKFLITIIKRKSLSIICQIYPTFGIYSKRKCFIFIHSIVSQNYRNVLNTAWTFSDQNVL